MGPKRYAARMWRRPARGAAAILAGLLLLLALVPLAPSAGGIAGQARGPTGVPGPPMRALSSPAHTSPYEIFNFKNTDYPVVDPRTGYVYVADDGTGRTTVYDPVGSQVVGFLDGVSGPMVFDNGSGDLLVLQGSSVLFVDPASGQVIATIDGVAPSGGRAPVMALDPADDLLFVAYNGLSTTDIWASSQIQVVNLRLRAVTADVSNLWWTSGLTYDPQTRKMYAVNLVGGMTVIDPATVTVVGAMGGLNGPNQIAVDPANGNLYVACWNGVFVRTNGTVHEVDTASVTVVDPRSLTILGNFTGFALHEFAPSYVVYNPADGLLYVGNATAVVAVDPASGAFPYEVRGIYDPGPLAVDPVNGHVYAAAGDNVVDVDPVTRNATIVGGDYDSPWGVAVDTLRNRVYASNSGGRDVVVIDSATDRILGHIGGFYAPDAVVYDPLADELFVGNEYAYGNYTLSIVNLTTQRIVGTVPGVNPWTTRFDNHSGTVLVGTDSGLMVISGRTNAIIENVTAFGGMSPMAVDSVNGRVFALHGPSAFSSGSYLLALNTSNWSLEWRLNVTSAGLAPTAIGFDPVNGNLYEAQWTTGVAVLDGSNGNVIARIPGPWQPQDVLYNPSNGYVYITDQGPYGNLWVVDPRTNEMAASIELPDQANRMAYDPANQEIYIGLGMYGPGTGLVLAVPSVRYPPPPITASPWFWPLLAVGVVVALIALAISLRQRRRSRPAPPEVPEDGPSPSSPMAPEEPTKPPAAKEQPPPWPRAERLALLSLAIGFLLALAALVGPWYVVTTKATAGPAFTDVRSYGLLGWSASDTVGATAASAEGNYLPMPSVGLAFATLEGVLVAALLALGVGAVLAVASSRNPRRLRNALLLAFAAGVLSLAGPIAFALLFPGAATSAGLLAGGAGYAVTSWGTGWAWLILLVAGALFLLGSTALLTRPRAAHGPSPA